MIRAPRNKDSSRPIIKRTRSWRGIMQVRFNDTKFDSRRLTRQAFIWSPLRVFGLGLLSMSIFYYILGHDYFMHSLMGYESEMQYEMRVNPTLGALSCSAGFVIDLDKGCKSPLRDLEKPLHPKREFDIFKNDLK
ncbi:unnamed protein product [Phytomonas sp. Hart1]|nr:unnamed protein product [Phytomonas sp. Hart1]|eukprot:CCW67432.1 unnamed protein product [Phytomonas sp. isolate Hart1]